LGKKNHKQILLGVVMVDGLPVTCHIFRGNRAEKTTLLWVKNKVKKQFNVGRVVFVCDRGLVSEESLTEIEVKGDGYIVALKRRRVKETEFILQQDIASFTPIQTGEKGEVLLYAWEAPEDEGKRRVVAYNPTRAKEEKEKREDIIRELEEGLQGLKARVEAGKVKKTQAIVTACERILSHKHGKRYFTYEVSKDGHFQFGLHEKNLALEENLDGKFVIKTTEHNFPMDKVIFKYKDLMDVEDSFRDLKDFIRVAPVFHWRYRRVKAHIFICVLALLLERYLEQKLKKQRIHLSARKALKKFGDIKVVENQVGNLILKYVTPPSQELGKLLSACGIFKLPKILDDVQHVNKIRHK
jgi:transposase